MLAAVRDRRPAARDDRACNLGARLGLAAEMTTFAPISAIRSAIAAADPARRAGDHRDFVRHVEQHVPFPVPFHPRSRR